MKNGKDESLFWREIDRLLIFSRAWQILKFSKDTLKKMRFVPDRVSVEELLGWALAKRLVHKQKEGLHFEFSQYMKNRFGHVKRGAEGRNIRLPFSSHTFVDLVDFDWKYNEENEEQERVQDRSTLGVWLITLRRLWPTVKYTFDWLANQNCLLYNPVNGQAQPVFPDTLLDRATFNIFWEMMIDLAVVTPMVMTTGGGCLWKILKKRAREIKQSIQDPWFLPKGLEVEISSLADVVWGCYYGTDTINPCGNLTMSAIRYRLVLRHLSKIDMVSTQNHGLPINGERVEPILFELNETGLLRRRGKTYLVRQERIVKVLKAIYCPHLIPGLFGPNSGLKFEIANGPKEQKDLLYQEKKSEEKERIIRRNARRSEMSDKGLFESNAKEVLRYYWLRPAGEHGGFTAAQAESDLGDRINYGANVLLADMVDASLLVKVGKDRLGAPSYSIKHGRKTEDLAIVGGFMAGLDRQDEIVKQLVMLLSRLRVAQIKKDSNVPPIGRSKLLELLRIQLSLTETDVHNRVILDAFTEAVRQSPGYFAVGSTGKGGEVHTFIVDRLNETCGPPVSEVGRE